MISQPKIVIRDGRHPCISNVESFVPNDTFIGTEGHPSILLLTGPNMGGKSTLMRQVALITVMAQIVRLVTFPVLPIGKFVTSGKLCACIVLRAESRRSHFYAAGG